MAIIDISSQPQFREIVRRIHALENAAPMNNAAVGRSGIEVYDGGTINVSSGNIIGAGTFSWQGSFSQSGTSILSGSTTIAGPTGITGQLTIQGATDVTGPFTVTGETKLNGVTDIGGATKITGTLDVTGATTLGGATEITGVTTLKADLNVEGSGKITAGNVTIDPSYLSGAIKFSNGTSLAATPNGVQVVSANGAGALVTSNGQASIGVIAGGEVIATASSVNILAPFSITIDSPRVYFPGTQTVTTSNPANVYMDENGRIYRKA